MNSEILPLLGQDRLVTGAMSVAELSDILNVGCLVVDPAYTIETWNEWLAAATGRSIQEAIGRNLLDLFPEIRGTARERALERALNGEAVVLAHHFHEYFIELPAPAGITGFARMQQSTRIVPRAEGSDVRGAVVLIQDVTERIARERDLDAARERAEGASKAKSEFLAMMSHELRTPLSAILGYADLLDSQIGGSLTETQLNHVHRITAGTWHLIRIIEGILTFSRIEAQAYEVALEQADLAEIIQQAVAMVQPLADEKGLTLDLQLPAAPVLVATDHLKLRQILVNVLGNAVKFTDAGAVKLVLEQVAESVLIRISDTGPGIPPTFHTSIFEAFVQVDQSNTRKRGGTGLGLPLSRKLAELLGGTLNLVSSDRSGTTFLLQIPMR